MGDHKITPSNFDKANDEKNEEEDYDEYYVLSSLKLKYVNCQYELCDSIYPKIPNLMKILLEDR